MRMMGQKKRSRLLEGVIVLGATACAYVFSVVLGLTAPRQDAVVSTAMVFAIVIAVLRPAWVRGAFWKGLAVMFSAHIVILRGRRDSNPRPLP